MRGAQRPTLCAVPSKTVLDLTSELESLGGGAAVAVGRAWAGAVVEAAGLDACSADANLLHDALQQELWPWLNAGYNSTALLLTSGSSCSDSCKGSEPGPPISAAGLAVRVGAAALHEGLALGLSWHLVDSRGARCSLGQQQQLLATAANRGGQRHGSRLGREAAAAVEPEAAVMVQASSAEELSQLLSIMQEQEHQWQQEAHVADGDEPALLLRIALQRPGWLAPAVLHVLQVSPGAPKASGSSSGGQWSSLLRLAGEVADLHQRRHEGDHLLSSTRLTPLNQLAAPLLASGARLFVAAAFGSGEGERQQQEVLPLLRALRHVQTVCTTAGTAAAAASPSAAATNPRSAVWLPCVQFLQQLEQRQQAERLCRAEAAALAAAEAGRREKLRAAVQRRQQGATPPADAPRQQQQQQQAATCDSRARRQQPAVPAAAEEELDVGVEQAALPPATSSLTASPVAAPAGERGGSLQQLRQQFRDIYASVTPAGQVPSDGACGSCSPPQRPGSFLAAHQTRSSSPVKQHRQQRQRSPHRSIAAGVAAADDIAMHVAALRMQAAAEARRALQAQQELLGEPPANPYGSTAAAHKSAAEPADASLADSLPGSSSGGGGLGQQLESELLHLRQAAAAGAAVSPARRAAAATPGGAAAGMSPGGDADVASLASLEAEAPSLAAIFRRPVSRLDSTAALRAAGWSGDGDSLQRERQQAQQEQQSQWQQGAGMERSWSPMAAAHDSPPPAWPLSAISSGAAGSACEVSDLLQSEHMPLFSPPGAAAAAAAAAGERMQRGWEAEASSSRPSSALQQQQQERRSGGSVGGSYAAAWRHDGGRSAGAAPAASLLRGGAPASTSSAAHDSQQWEGAGTLHTFHACAAPGSAAEQEAAEQGSGAAGQEPEVEVSALLGELRREQRVNATLLQQLHEVQHALEDALAAAAAAGGEPQAAGVQDPADFNGMLAALQRERQRSAALERQLALQSQQGEERELALEARMHTLQRQLLAAAARCRAWEQQSPLAALFRRCDEDLQRAEAEGASLAEENRQLAALLAEADLERLQGAAQRLGEEPTAAVCRDHQRQLQAAQAQLRRLREREAALVKEVQAAARRDRLAELCRRQAESGQRAAADLRRRLAEREQQLEVQCLAAAAAAAGAARLEARLRQSEVQLGAALADRADLADAVGSLRHQVALLRGQGSRDRILKSMQLPAPP